MSEKQQEILQSLANTMNKLDEVDQALVAGVALGIAEAKGGDDDELSTK